MDEARRPLVVAFDVVETLFALAPVGETLRGFGQSESALDRFFARMLRDGFAVACSGRYRSFGEVAGATLAVTAPSLSGEERATVIGAFRRLPAHPDVRPAFELLRAHGIRVTTLTNGSAVLTSHLLEQAQLAGLVERIVSVDEIGVWKPQAAPYLHAATTFGVQPHQTALVAVHAWDTHGARTAGLVSGWAARLEGTYSAVFEPPHVQGDDLVAVAEALVRLPE
jgi:2-haloacid dehalogenase